MKQKDELCWKQEGRRQGQAYQAVSKSVQVKGMQEIVDYLHDNAVVDIGLCGPAVVKQFRKAARHPFSSLTILRRLVALAKDKLSSYHYKSVPMCWMQLYTDASIAQAAALLSTCRQSDALLGIESLDMALIVAGAPGSHRRAFIFTLMASLQDLCTTHCQPVNPVLSVRCDHSIPAIAPIAGLAISEVSPHQVSYLTHLSSPVIVRRGAVHWPAVKKWANLSYIQQQAGPGRCVPVEVGASYTNAAWTQRIMPFETILSSISGTTPASAEVLYLAQYDLFSQIPQLRDDIIIPDQVYTVLPEASSYEPPQTANGLDVNAWLGPQGTTSPAHTDPYYNAYVQVVGRKHVWLAAPKHHTVMSSIGKKSESHTQHDAESAAKSLMDNTCALDVFDVAARTSNADFSFSVFPEARHAILHPGDLLLMPPMWWHALRSLDVSFSVSIWF